MPGTSQQTSRSPNAAGQYCPLNPLSQGSFSVQVPEAVHPFHPPENSSFPFGQGSQDEEDSRQLRGILITLLHPPSSISLLPR